MQFKQFVALIPILLGTSTVAADTTKFQFSATKIHKLTGGAETKSALFPNCWVYCFWARTHDGSLEYVHFDNSPSQTDASGLCGYDCQKDAPYFVYFSGRQLTNEQIDFIRARGDSRLIKLLATESQPSSSHFQVEQTDGSLAASLKYSLPLWLTHLHKVEDAIGAADNKVVLTKVRKLFYDGTYWPVLIPRNVDPLITFDRMTGAITNEINVDLCHAVSRTYELSNNTTYVVQSGQRQMESRFDFVSLRDGSVIHNSIPACMETQTFRRHNLRIWRRTE